MTDATILHDLAIGATGVVAILTGTYVYFWGVALWARAHKHIDRSPVTNFELSNLISHARRTRKTHRFTLQITTKGGSAKVVSRGIRYALAAVAQYPALKSIVKIEVITEDQDDKLYLDRTFKGSIVPVTTYILPADYHTPNKTELKARALHYMVELHRKSPSDSFIVHYDEESVLTEDNLARLVRNLITKQYGISEGTISYPLEWNDSHAMCRTMESSRPFGCHECYLVMTSGLPLHLHGSNLVVKERLENEIGWDIGRLGDKPLIAEDLVFGLMFMLRFGKAQFGWHGVEMIEQPPFTLKAAYKQRERWVMGALQGVAHVRNLPGWKSISTADRLKIQLVIRARVLTYAIGAPISLIALSVLGFIVSYDLMSLVIGGRMISTFTLTALPGLALWLGSNQLGLWQNLRYTDKTFLGKLYEHLRVLILTPFSGLFDTTGPAVALIKWAVGVRGVVWHPTPKNVGQEYGEAVA